MVSPNRSKDEVVYYIDSGDQLLKWSKQSTPDSFKFKDVHILMQYIKIETNP